MNKLTTVVRGDAAEKNHRGFVNAQDFDPTRPDRDKITVANGWPELGLIQTWYLFITFAADTFAFDTGPTSRHLCSQNIVNVNSRGMQCFLSTDGKINIFFRSVSSSSRQALMKSNDSCVLRQTPEKQNIFQYCHQGGTDVYQDRMYVNGRKQTNIVQNNSLILGDDIQNGTIDFCIGHSCATFGGNGDFDGRIERLTLIEGIPSEQQIREHFNTGRATTTGGQTYLADIDFNQTSGTPQDLSPNAYPVTLVTSPANYVSFIA